MARQRVVTVLPFRKPGWRTPEEIRQQMERRLAELEDEAARRTVDPELNFPCRSCRYYSTRGDDGYRWGSGYPQYATCVNPLVKGFDKWGVRLRSQPALCGPEKALWRPVPSLFERFTEWVKGLLS